MRVRAPIVVVIAAAVVTLLAPTAARASEGASRQMDDARPLVPLAPAIVEYRWHLWVPEWIVETRHVRSRIYAPTWKTGRIDYALPDIRIERRRIGSAPEFSCKYPGFDLPNECRTTWHAVYADVPVPVMHRDTLDVDVPRWSWQDRQTPVDVPRLVWKAQMLVVSVPALAVPDAANPPSK
jgi:hypothetical protein